MNPAEGSEVRELASAAARDVASCLNHDQEPVLFQPLRGDVRAAFVAAFCAELMAAEGITLKRLRAAMAPALLMLAIMTAGADDWKVDDSGPWYSPSESHHGKHFAGGAVIGAATYCGAAALGVEDRLPRYVVAVGAGAVVGLGYEIAHGSDTTLVDPVDAAWVTAGSLVGAVVADLTDQVLELSVGPRWAGIGARWRW